jgi:hypothetical protein
MENKSLNNNSQKIKSNQLEWGDHNPKLTDHNFIDRNHKKISDQNELLSPSNAPIDLSKEEPGRNRKGVKEGQSKS